MGISDLKITLKSILTSSQKSLTPRELLRDFKEIEGYDFPYQKFGFSDFTQCLTSPDMADTVKVRFEGGSQVVFPVASEKSKHIDELVMKQKSKPSRVRSSRRAPIPRRAPPPRTSNRAPRFNAKPFPSSSSYTNNANYQSAFSSSSKPFSSSSSYANNANRQPVFPSSACYVRQFSNATSSASASNYQNGQAYQSSTTCKTYSSQASNNYSSNSYSSYSTDRKPGQSSSVSSQSKPLVPVPTYMKDKVIDFLRSKPQGAREDDISRFLVTKNFRDYGFSTTQSFLNSLQDIVEERNGYIYLRRNYVQSNASQSTKSATYSSVVPGGFEDEAYEDSDVYYSDEDYDGEVAQVNGKALTEESTSTCVQSGSVHLNDDTSGRKSPLDCRSRSSVCSFDDSDSGCVDAANEKMGSRMRQNFQTLLDRYPDGIKLINLGHAYKELFNHPLNFADIGFSSMIEFVANHPSIFFCLRLEQNDDFVIFDAKKEIPLKYKLQAQNRAKHKKIPLDVYENMKQLLQSKKHSGLLSTEVEKLYHRKYGVELSLAKLGFDSVNSFFIALTDLCYLRPVRQKFRAYPKISPEDSEENSRETEQFLMPMIIQQLFPPECCDNNCRISQQKINDDFLQRSEDGNKLFIEIVIAEVYSPVKFWFHLRLKTPELHNMMDDLDNFYNEEQLNYCMPPTTISIGQICASKYHHDGRWHRVKILSIPSLHEVTVFYLDYGTVSKVAKTELRFLHKDFEDMPAQAIRGRLCNVKPADGNRWAIECNEFFLNLTEDQGLMAEVIDIKTKDEILQIDMVLWDTNGEEDVIVNEVLIEKGFADYETLPTYEGLADSDGTSDLNNIVSASNLCEIQNTSVSSQGITSSEDASPKMGNQTVDSLLGFQQTSTPETSHLDVTGDLDNSTKLIARHWSSENLNEQSVLSTASNPESQTVDSIRNILRSLVTKIPSMMTTDSVSKAMKSASVDSRQNPMQSSEAYNLNQTFIPGSNLNINQSFPGQNFPSSFSQVPNAPLQYQQHLHNYLTPNQPALNYHQSAYLQSNLQNSFLQNRPLNLLPPPGLVNPHYPTNQLMDPLNRPYPSPQVPNPQYASNSFLNQSAQPAQSHQFYPNFQMQNQLYANPYVQKQHFPNLGTSNMMYQNVPQNPMTGSNNFLPHHAINLDPNFQNFYASNPNVTNPNMLPNTKNVSHSSYLPNTPSVPSNLATVSAFASQRYDPLSVNVTPDIQPQPYTASSMPISSEKDSTVPSSQPEISTLLKKLSPGAQNVKENQTGLSQVASQPCTTQPSRSLPSKEAEEIFKEDLIHKVVDKIVQKFTQSVDITVDSSHSSKVSDAPPNSRNSSPPTVVDEGETSGLEGSNRDFSKNETKVKSPFEMLCEKMKTTSSSSSSSSNLLHKIFPQLESKANDSEESERTGQLSSIPNFETEISCPNQELLKESQNNQISSTTSDNDNQKSSWNLTWKKDYSNLDAHTQAIKTVLNDKLTNIVVDYVKNSGYINSKANASKSGSENEGCPTSTEMSRPTDGKKLNELQEKVRRLTSDNTKENNEFINFNVENQNLTFNVKPELTDNKLSSILPKDIESTPPKEVDPLPIKSSGRNNSPPEKIVIADKELHLLMIDSVPHIITDEFMILFTAFTKRLSMMKILMVQHMDLPFQDHLTQNLPRSLSEEVLSTVRSHEKFNKINILPLKSVPKLMESLNIPSSLIEALYVSGKCFDLPR